MNKHRGWLLLLVAGTSGSAPWVARSAGPSFMHTSGRTTQPVGHYELCQRSPAECNTKNAPARRRSN